MTLSPVFRSRRAVAVLQQERIWDRFMPAVERQRAAIERVRNDLHHVIDPAYLEEAKGRPEGAEALTFMQDYFFLNLFLSLFEALGVDQERLGVYAEIDFCIMGTITAADNLFDDQDKSLLPLRSAAGARYRSILQLMCFERLLRRIGDRAAQTGKMETPTFEQIQFALMNQMAEIGRLEGSEEAGVEEIPEPNAMVDNVHRIRGGRLFGLAFAAPEAWETGPTRERILAAEPAIARLGTAFQIVDDLTDFEFDLTRLSHNLLVAEIQHNGRPEECAELESLRRQRGDGNNGLVERLFADSARRVLERARIEARAAFSTLAELGFWFPVELSDEVVHAIVGLDGIARMDAIRAGDGA